MRSSFLAVTSEAPWPATTSIASGDITKTLPRYLVKATASGIEGTRKSLSETS